MLERANENATELERRDTKYLAQWSRSVCAGDPARTKLNSLVFVPGEVL